MALKLSKNNTRYPIRTKNKNNSHHIAKILLDCC